MVAQIFVGSQVWVKDPNFDGLQAVRCGSLGTVVAIEFTLCAPTLHIVLENSVGIARVPVAQVLPVVQVGRNVLVLHDQ